MRLARSTGSQIALPYKTTVAEVTMTANAARRPIGRGRPTLWPSTWSRWVLAKRVKSGMFRARVAQKDAKQGVDHAAAEPGLDAVPAAGDDGAHQGGQARAAGAEGGAGQHRVGDAVFGAGVADQEHGQQDDGVGEEDRQHRLVAGHAPFDQAGRQGVGGDAHDHADPEGGEVVPAPGALGGRGGGEVCVPEVGAAVVVRIHCHTPFTVQKTGTGSECQSPAYATRRGLRESWVQFMYGLPVSCGTMVMQDSTGQVISQRLQPTHSSLITS